MVTIVLGSVFELVSLSLSLVLELGIRLELVLSSGPKPVLVEMFVPPPVQATKPNKPSTGRNKRLFFIKILLFGNNYITIVRAFNRIYRKKNKKLLFL